jgi:hypothetical protein
LTSRRPLVVVLSLLFPAMIVIFAACSDEAEGERCDTRNTRNGSDDCQPGLVCVPGGDLGSAGSEYCLANGSLVTTCGVCCPVNRANATVSICQLSSTLPGADAAPPDTDAGDAASDASDASDTDAADAGDTDADAASTDASDADASDASDASDDGG